MEGGGGGAKLLGRGGEGGMLKCLNGKISHVLYRTVTLLRPPPALKKDSTNSDIRDIKKEVSK